MPDPTTTPAAGLAGVILMLAADASDRGGLRLREEYRHIRSQLAPLGYASRLRQLVHARLDELEQLLRDHDDVRVLHLSGRLGGAGLRLLEPTDRGEHRPDPAAFMAAFAQCERIDCVFVNARHSATQIRLIGHHVEWIVAMNDEVEDAVAIAFAGHFYTALAEGARIASAFRVALTKAKLGEEAHTLAPTLHHHGVPTERDRGTLLTTLADAEAANDRASDDVPGSSDDSDAEDAAPDASEVARDADAARSDEGLPGTRDAQATSTPGLEKLVPIDENETRILVDLIEEQAGIALFVDPGLFLQHRLSPRLEALGMSRFLEYCDYIVCGTKGERELVELVESITTHETYFFREQYQLDVLSSAILPELIARPGRRRPLRIWSAGCSTGEEAYTLALLLLERTAFGHEDVRIVGTDISPKVIEIARQASYGENSFRTMTPALRRKYFVEREDRWVVRGDVREMCEFEPLNLMSTERFGELGTQDVILCRNVLMYLSTQVRRAAVQAFYDCLRPGGYLLLGHSDSLLNQKTRFEFARLQKELVYRKPR